MPSLKLTAAAVEKLKAPAVGQVDYWDTHIKLFGVRVSYKGTKTWVVQPRVMREGKKKSARFKLGRYPTTTLAEARELAREYLKLAEAGKDPKIIKEQERRQRERESKNTFAAVREAFLEEYCTRKDSEGHTVMSARTKAEYTRVLNREFKDWEKRPISSIERSEVKARLKTIAKKAPIASNRALAALRRMLNWAAEEDLIATPPTDHVRPVTKEIPRDRFLTNDEIRIAWQAFTAIGPYGNVLKLALLLGQRIGQILAMRRNDLYDLDGAHPRWEIPRHQQQKVKTGGTRVIPLPALAVGVLNEIPENGPYVFSSDGKHPWHYQSKYTEAARIEVEKVLKTEKGKERDPEKQRALDRCFTSTWRPHDLRHTLKTHLHEMDVAPHVCDDIVGHKKKGMDAVYVHSQYVEAKRRALNMWSAHIQSLVKLTAP